MRYLFVLVCVTPCVILLCVFLTNRFSNLNVEGQTIVSEETSEIRFDLLIERGDYVDEKKEYVRSRIDAKKVVPKHYVPKFMMDLYESSKSEYRNVLGRPEIVKSVIPTHAGLTNFNENHRIVFEIPSHDEDEQFLEAELRISTIAEGQSSNKRSQGEIEKLLKISIYDFQSNMLQYLQEKRISHQNNSWISFDLTKTIERLMNTNAANSAIAENALEVHIDVVNMKISLNPNPENMDHEYPILLLSYSSKRDQQDEIYANDIQSNIIRNRRAVVEEDYEEETNKIWVEEIPSEQVNQKGVKKYRRMRNLCRRKSLYIDFAEISYDSWIVQPAGYEAYQCVGKCFYPVAAHLTPTKHAIMQALLHSVSPSQAPRSCCVPTRLDSISVLYVDNRGILTYRYGYKDMVVTECGCR